ncbi:hypothetical protein [Arthrobacter sp. ov118]|uniref:DUF7793 family protein n=1 Tax=Arthrobacter sp. ov118 TaxID=1761747 RepID=UPI0008ED40C3|nr:hypothetical protein [Arthrobacter sp. ov118]SFU13383.1 hypothetical protein SAMN04487915_112116 [Arthrobacter sp. ov118]
MTVEALAGPDERLPDETAGGIQGAAIGAARAIQGAAIDAARAIQGAAIDAARAIGVRMLEGGIIEVLLPANQEIQGPEARIAGEAVRSLAAGRRVPVILVITGVVGVSVEARQAYTGSIAATAFALVGETPVDRVIAHYLLRSRGESIPAQFFTSESAAIEWLRQYVREE